MVADKPREGATSLPTRINEADILPVSDVLEYEEIRKHPLIESEQIRSFVGVSLHAGDEQLGIMYVNFRRPVQISEIQLAPIREYASKVVLAIRHGREMGRIQLPGLLEKIARHASGDSAGRFGHPVRIPSWT